MRIKRAGRWTELSYAELAERVQAASLGFRELGIGAGDRVAILSENRPEWAITDYACLAARCADVPVYPTLPAKQVEYILRDSGAVAIFASTRKQLEKLLEVRGRLPGLRHIVSYDPDATGPGVLNIEELYALGRAALDGHPD
jgi:long-chain acyl-CoA synthetase